MYVLNVLWVLFVWFWDFYRCEWWGLKILLVVLDFGDV